MKTDLLASRHIGINEQDTAVMLRKIGVESLDELIDKTIPANIRLKEPLALTSPLTEYEFGKHIATLAGKNKLYTTYIGLGWYNTITPAVIQLLIARRRYCRCRSRKYDVCPPLTRTTKVRRQCSLCGRKYFPADIGCYDNTCRSSRYRTACRQI